MELTYTRRNYIVEQRCTHEQYYAQFCVAHVMRVVTAHIGAARIAASVDPHFNDIPLGEWDRLNGIIGGAIGGALGQSNRSMYAPEVAAAEAARRVVSYSLSDTVCVAKTAAAIIAGRIDALGNPITAA